MSRTESEQPADLVRLRQRLDEYRRGSRLSYCFPSSRTRWLIHSTGETSIAEANCRKVPIDG